MMPFRSMFSFATLLQSWDWELCVDRSSVTRGLCHSFAIIRLLVQSWDWVLLCELFPSCVLLMEDVCSLILRNTVHSASALCVRVCGVGGGKCVCVCMCVRVCTCVFLRVCVCV